MSAFSNYFFPKTSLHMKRRRGFTLTEVAIVLGVVGLVVGGVWSAASSISYSNKINDEIRETLDIVSNVRAIYGRQQHFSQTTPMNDVTLQMVQMGVFPSYIPIRPDGYPAGPEGGRIRFDLLPNSPNWNNAQFEIEFFGTPQTCREFLFKMSGIKGGPVYVYPGGTSIGWLDPAGAVPLTMADFGDCTYASFTFNLH